MKFKVSAILPIPAEVYFVERDSSAFRSLVAEVMIRLSTISLAFFITCSCQCRPQQECTCYVQSCKLESLEMGDSWMEGDTEVYEFVTKPDVYSYCPQHLKKFLPMGELSYVDVIVSHSSQPFFKLLYFES